jgi:two-component system, chemotaxis family, CheB/CheR fusion protein
LNTGRGRLFTSQLPNSIVRQKPLVTIVEGDANDRGALVTLLSELPIEVEGYASAESFLSANHVHPACVISDVTLPGMSGLDLLRQLRRAGFGPPVIMLGDEADVVSAVAAMRAGANDFIEKTHADLAIARRVAQLLERQLHS